MDDAPAWLDELDLDPGAEPVRMGTRRLGDRPWLLADADRSEQLELKARLSRTRPDEVFATLPDTERAGAEVAQLVADTGVVLVDGDDLHPLDRAGRSVQEDLCLLRRTDAGWILVAASLCFPSRWRLAEKLGRDITAVHDPVPGYRRRLAPGVTHLFDRLAELPVVRRNWFIHPDPALFQPGRPPGGDPLVPAERCLDELYVRSERQTLRTLADRSWILFTIKIQQATLRELVDRRRAEVGAWLAGAPESARTHRGVPPDQAVELRHALGA